MILCKDCKHLITTHSCRKLCVKREEYICAVKEFSCVYAERPDGKKPCCGECKHMVDDAGDIYCEMGTTNGFILRPESLRCDEFMWREA